MARRLYVPVVQAVLLFGSDTWVLTPRLGKSLEGFHHRVARRMADMGPKCQWDRTWVYPPIWTALKMVGLEEIGVFIICHHNTVKQYITTHPIMDLCLVEERKLVMHIYRRWWDHTALEIMGIIERKSAAEWKEDSMN